MYVLQHSTYTSYTWFRHVCTRLCQVGRIPDGPSWWAPANLKLRDQQASSLRLYQAKSTKSAEQKLLYELFFVLYLLFWFLTRIEPLVTSTYALQANIQRIYERYHAITSRRKLSLLAYGPNPCHFLLYYSHYVTIISYYTNYFRNQKCDLGAYSLQKTSQSWAYKPRA